MLKFVDKYTAFENFVNYGKIELEKTKTLSSLYLSTRQDNFQDFPDKSSRNMFFKILQH